MTPDWLPRSSAPRDGDKSTTCRRNAPDSFAGPAKADIPAKPHLAAQSNGTSQHHIEVLK